MGLHEKKYLEPYINSQYIWLKHNAAQYNFILVRFEIFPEYLRMFCIHIFSIRKWVLTKWTVGNLWISETKWTNCNTRRISLIWNIIVQYYQRYWLFMHDAKYIFPQTSFVKPRSEIWETLAHVRIIWCFFRLYMYFSMDSRKIW